MKFRSKPMEIEAEQMLEGEPVPPGVMFRRDGTPYVVTADSHEIPVREGDWVIKEADGRHYYPCNPEHFANRWERVHA